MCKSSVDRGQESCVLFTRYESRFCLIGEATDGGRIEGSTIYSEALHSWLVHEQTLESAEDIEQCHADRVSTIVLEKLWK